MVRRRFVGLRRGPLTDLPDAGVTAVRAPDLHWGWTHGRDDLVRDRAEEFAFDALAVWVSPTLLLGPLVLASVVSLAWHLRREPRRAGVVRRLVRPWAWGLAGVAGATLATARDGTVDDPDWAVRVAADFAGGPPAPRRLVVERSESAWIGDDDGSEPALLAPLPGLLIERRWGFRGGPGGGDFEVRAAEVDLRWLLAAGLAWNAVTGLRWRRGGRVRGERGASAP